MMVFVYLIILVATLVYILFKIRFAYWSKRGVPGPKPTFLFGNVLQAFTGRKSMGDVITDIYNDYEGYPFVGYFRGSTPVLLIRDPDFIRAITVKDFQHFVDNDIHVDKKRDPVISKNPFFMKGQEWKTARSHLTPSFTAIKMKHLFPILDHNSNRLVNYLELECKSDEGILLELKEISSRYTIDNVASSGFGVEGRSIENPDSKFRNLAKRFLNPGTMTSIKMTMLFLLPWLAKFLCLKMVDKHVECELLAIIKSTLKHRKDNDIQSNDFLALLAQTKDESGNNIFNEEDLAGHAATFFGDAYETSSIVMSFILFEISRNSLVQTKLRQEIEETIKKYNGQLSYEAINDTPYLDAVVEETLRKYPVIWLLNKVCTQRYAYKSEGRDNFKDMSVTIEEGTPITLPTWALTHDPQYFEEPDRFDPDRFLDNKNAYKYIHFPFGEGPRQCIGKRFGLLQIKIAVAKLVKNFEIRINLKTKLPLHFDPFYFMPSPYGGLWVNVYKIK